MAKKSASTGARSSHRKTAPVTEAVPPAKKPRAKKQEAATSPSKTAAKARSSPKAAKSAKTAKTAKTAKPEKSKAGSARKTGAVAEPPNEFPSLPHNAADDPIGDLSDGEGRVYMHGEQPESLAEMVAYRADTADDALEGTLEIIAGNPASVIEAQPAANAGPATRTSPSGAPAVPEQAEPASSPHSQAASAQPETRAPEEEPAKLDRLQKILSQAGVASRRHAEEMILAGRVMVNGQVITQLGAKADPARDHIRVDGKHIPAAERHRYFMLNKPRGYVTTVSDPEGRPTVMQFFSKMRERLYPVGRLDYDSEGLLLVTNDGELANQLTRAASGVEKTYLVKIAGRPTEEELGRLRSGVFIERGRPGSDQAQTAPARIREMRHGKSGPPRRDSHAHDENPWYEVVLIEGRNRELHKMFQSIGHFVEKIRRVGYGPLVLDIEPGQMRELTPQELSQLRRAAEGKSHPSAAPRGFAPPREQRDREPRRDQQERGQQPRGEPRRRDQRFIQGYGQKFDPRNQGRRDRFSSRRPDRDRDDRRPAGRPSFARPFNAGEGREERFRRPDSGRGPQIDPRRGDAQRGGSRGTNRGQTRGPNRGFDRGPDRHFGSPRQDFGRSGFNRPGAAAGENDWRSRPQNRFGPGRNESSRYEPARNQPRRSEQGRDQPGRNESARFGSRRGASRPFGSDRFGSDRSGGNRGGPDRGGKRRFGKDGPGADREGSRAGFGSSEENPKRGASKKFPPRSARPSSPAREPGAGFRRGGRPKRNPPRSGGKRG
jgi:23S rRNA pseudouridine2605 synthase